MPDLYMRNGKTPKMITTGGKSGRVFGPPTVKTCRFENRPTVILESKKIPPMNSILRFLALTIFAACLVFTAEAQEPSAAPKRIVSLSPPATEQIFILGAGERIVGCTSYCTRPAEAEKKEKIGSLRDINLEKLVSLSPDLVLASSITKPAIVEKLRGFGIRVHVQKSPEDFNGLLEQFVELGTIIGEREKAARTAKAAEMRLRRIKETCSLFRERPKVVFQVGAKPMYLSGKDSFVGDFISHAGAVNILGDLSGGVYSREMIVAENPDVILLSAMGFATEEEKREWTRFDSISAVRSGRIFMLESSEVCSPSPPDLPATLAKIAKMLHPGHAEEIDKALEGP